MFCHNNKQKQSCEVMDLLTNSTRVLILQYVCVLNHVIYLKCTQCYISSISIKLEKWRYFTFFFFPAWSSKSSMYFTVMAHLKLGQLHVKCSGGQWITQVQKQQRTVKSSTPTSGAPSRKSSRRKDKTFNSTTMAAENHCSQKKATFCWCYMCRHDKYRGFLTRMDHEFQRAMRGRLCISGGKFLYFRTHLLFSKE